MRATVAATVLVAVAAGAATTTDGERKCYVATGTSASEHPRCMELMKDSFWVAWKTDRDAGVITFAAGRTGDGWLAVAIGEEQNGGMKGADIIAVHEMNGAMILQDMHSTKYERPDVDQFQNAELLSEGSADGYYRAQFRRPLVSCDTQDHGIRKGYPHTLVWALGMGFNFGYHGQKARGSVVVNFDDPDPLEWNGGTPDTTGLHSFKAKYNRFHVPTADRPDGLGGFVEGSNQYKCMAVPLKNITHRQPPFDIIVASPIVGSAFIHHFVNSQCNFDPRPDSSIPYGEDPANDIYDCAMGGGTACAGIGGWAAGGTSVVYPKGTGVRIQGDTEWLVLDTHFYNPSLNKEARDSSGFEWTLSESLQPMLLGSIWIGVAPTMSLPPGKKESPYGMHCPANQVALMFPDGVDEVTMVNTWHHLHQAGRVARTYIVRDGKRIPLGIQNNYDYNFQAVLPVRHKLKRGDALEVYCGFDTQGATKPVRWGERTQDEMCISINQFYPGRADNPQAFCLLYDLPKHLDPAGPTTTWSLLTDADGGGVFSAMMSGCRTPPAACSAALWNAVCHQVGPCFLHEICDVASCKPNDGSGQLKFCAPVYDLCKPCYEDGPGECTECTKPCQRFIDSGRLVNATKIHEVMHPAPSRGQIYSSTERWHQMEHDLPWGPSWAEDLSHQCNPSCVGCDTAAPFQKGSSGEPGNGLAAGHGHGDNDSNTEMIIVIVLVGGVLPLIACVVVLVYLKTRRAAEASKPLSSSTSSHLQEVQPAPKQPVELCQVQSPTSPVSPSSPTKLIDQSKGDESREEESESDADVAKVVPAGRRASQSSATSSQGRRKSNIVPGLPPGAV
eukprot:TRINITY_DN1188_c1_g1_i1.p1 TRINITY_DN1188_c1_g1~~TRINITY_DN1188_c1_g1_i1.p1  ORF type:complete len:870 (+),score=198.79 TRINITY_DN1188_c1_g1_i1:85-2610(+)